MEIEHQLNVLPTNINNDIRNGFIGFAATLSADIINNPLRIIKTYKQTYNGSISYYDSWKNIISNKKINMQSFISIISRGMYIKTMLNCLTSSIYVILWKRFENLY